MKNEIRNHEGQVLFTAEVQENKLNINDATGQKLLCCIEQKDTQLQLKDANDKIIMQIENRIKTPTL
ncbi:MAG: hypothetical protein HY062_13700 [Bacteroidetes bacterium]|nr:hypothetical protein [Bacteroidota bacterium]